jgi:ABC-2 type transport system ATP-binding protein
VRLRTPDPDDAVRVLRGLGLAAGAGQDGEVTAPLPEGPAVAPQPPPEDLVSALVAAGVRVRGFAVEQGSLEDRFVELTGEGFDVAR